MGSDDDAVYFILLQHLDIILFPVCIFFCIAEEHLVARLIKEQFNLMSQLRKIGMGHIREQKSDGIGSLEVQVSGNLVWLIVERFHSCIDFLVCLLGNVAPFV